MKEIWIGTAAGARQVTEAWVGAAGSAKQVYALAGGGGGFAAVIDPNALTWTGFEIWIDGSVLATAYQAALSVTATGGTAPYSYAWTQSGATDGFDTPTAATTTLFSLSDAPAVASCTVTDALGAVAVSNIATIG